MSAAALKKKKVGQKEKWSNDGEEEAAACSVQTEQVEEKTWERTRNEASGVRLTRRKAMK